MNGVRLTTVGRLLGHRQRETTAIYAHLDDSALRDAAPQAAAVIARAMGYRAEAPPLTAEAGETDEADNVAAGTESDRLNDTENRISRVDPPELATTRDTIPSVGSDFRLSRGAVGGCCDLVEF